MVNNNKNYECNVCLGYKNNKCEKEKYNLKAGYSDGKYACPYFTKKFI